MTIETWQEFIEKHKFEIWMCLNGIENNIDFDVKRKHRIELEKILGLDKALKIDGTI